LTIGSKIIATGIVNKGKLISGNKCYIGPDIDGQFQIVEILNIQCKKIPVKIVYKGQYCSISLKSESKLNIRKGMVLLDFEKNPPAAVKTFEAEIWTIDGRKKIIKNKYQPVLNIKHIRQGCRILKKSIFSHNQEASSYCNNTIPREEMEKCSKESAYNNEVCMTNSYNCSCEGIPDEAFSIGSKHKTKLLFEFMFNPEYVSVGSHIIINDQLIKAYGTITKILN
jgi:GTPase